VDRQLSHRSAGRPHTCDAHTAAPRNLLTLRRGSNKGVLRACATPADSVGYNRVCKRRLHR
jgi:hypothetical protein